MGDCQRRRYGTEGLRSQVDPAREDSGLLRMLDLVTPLGLISVVAGC